MLTTKPKGTQDIYGADSYHWHWMEKKIREIAEFYGATEIRTPTFEHTELFAKNVGETTDIVNKEMYTFLDRGGRSLTLRPEGTAGAIRCFVEEKLYAGTLPLKLYYMMSNFRGEKPQKGRFREHRQFGVEFIGPAEAENDVEVIAIAKDVLEAIGAKATLNINSIGEADAREKYHNVLKEYIGDNLESMCADCKSRIDRNPLRALDCKVPNCKEIMDGAPSIQDSLNEADKDHFERVLKLLDALSIKYVVNPRIVRGLDYYTRTVFEFIDDGALGAQSTVCGGGRYDNMVEQTGGPKMGCVGFGMGMERLLMSAKANGKVSDLAPRRQIFIGYIGEAGRVLSQKIVYELRQKGVHADGDTMGRGVKAQLKYADKINAKYSLVLGDDEIEKGAAQIKDMDTGDKYDVDINELEEFCKKSKAD